LPIISCYPRAFDILDFESKNFKLSDEDKNTHTIAYREDSLFLKDSFSRQIGATTETEITHGYLLAAGCLFAPGSFVTEVPYDPEFYFYGEEISLMLRAFTRGFGIFHIPAVPIFHLYTDTSDIKRRLHWDEEEDSGREIKWHEREEKSLNKLSKLIAGQIDGIYGLGTKRDLSDYEFLSGVDLKNKLVSNKTKAISAEFISTLSWKDSPF
jgi:GT2 family glycosyltransferase